MKVHVLRWVLLPIVVVLGAGCPGGGQNNGNPDGGGGGGQSGLTKTAYDLDSANATTSTIGPDGGQLVATGADGTTYTVDVPAGAVLAPTDFTATPLANLTVGGKSETWQTGVDLQPHGLGFVHPVTLTVAPASAPPAGAAIVWVDKADQTFAPMSDTGKVTASLDHFSVYVVTLVNEARLTEAASTAKTALAAATDLHWVLVSGAILQSATGLNLAGVISSAKTAIAGAGSLVSAAGDAGVKAPGPSTLVPVLLVGTAASDAGATSVADTANQAATHIFDAWLAALNTALQTSGPSFDLVPPAEAIVSFAKASIPSRTSPAIQFTEDLVSGLQAIADNKCDTGDYSGGTADLAKLAGIADAESLANPSGDALRADSATCVPPVVAFAAAVPTATANGIAHASVTADNTAGPALGDPAIAAPPYVSALDGDGCRVYSGGAFSMVSSLSNPDYTATADDAATGQHADWTVGGNLSAAGDTYDFNYAGSDSATYVVDNNVQISQSGGTSSSQFDLTIQVHNPRGAPFSVQIDRAATVTPNGPAGTHQLTFNVLETPLSCQIGQLTGATWGTPDDGGTPEIVNVARGTTWLTFDLQVAINASAGGTYYSSAPGNSAQGSIRVKGDIRFTVIPPHP